MTESCRRWKGSISDLGEWTYEGSPNLTVGADGNSNRYDESICRYVKFHTGGNQNFGFCSFGDRSFFYFIGNCFPRNKNAPRGSHCGGVEDVACATRRRRRILQRRILFHICGQQARRSCLHAYLAESNFQTRFSDMRFVSMEAEKMKRSGGKKDGKDYSDR